MAKDREVKEDSMPNENIFVSLDEMLTAITTTWGQGCSIQFCSIVDGVYHLIGYKPLPNGSQVKVLWLLNPKEKIVSIHLLLPVLPGSELMTIKEET